MYALYFICPLVFLLLGLILPPLARPDLPKGLNLNVGVINTRDIKRMSPQQLARLRASLRKYFFLAFAAAALIALAFTLFVSPWSAFSPFICNILGLVIGMIVLRFVLKEAASLKQELQNRPPQG